MKIGCHFKHRRIISFLFLIGFLGVGWRGWAKSDESLEDAKKAFTEAQTLYLKGQYEPAALKFMEAFKHKPYPAFLFNAAVCYEKARKYKEAVQTFKRYLELSGSSSDATAIRKRMKALEKYIQKPECESNGDCPKEKECIQGKCQSPPATGQCRVDSDCEANQICKDGRCRAKPRPEPRPGACQKDSDCGPKELCKGGVCKVVVPAVECRKDDECGKGKVCEASKCVPVKKAALPPPLPPIAPKGVVVIESKPPGATVWINDKMKPPAGKTPLQTTLPEGSHTIIVEQKGYKPIKRKVSVSSQQMIVLLLGLSEEHYLGWLKVTASVPGAKVFIDDMSIGAAGRTPFTGFRNPGKHTLWVAYPGYETLRREVEVVSGKPHTFHFVLKRLRYGWLRLTGARVKGAVVKVDGKEVCRAPCHAVRIPAGVHVLKVDRRGHKPLKKVIQVEQGRYTIVTAKLTKLPSRLSAWVTYGFATATLIAAIVSVVQGDAIKSNIEDDIRKGRLVPSNDSRFKKGKIWYIVGDSLFGLTAVVTAVALYYTFRAPGPKSSAEITIRGVSLTPQVGPGAVALTGRWRF